MNRQLAFEARARGELAREVADVLFRTDTCLALATNSRWLSVTWPGNGSRSRAEANFPREGTRSAPGLEPSWGCTQEFEEFGRERAHTFSIPAVLVGPVESKPYLGGMGVVLQHTCPQTRCSWLGPRDKTTAERLVRAIQRRFIPDRFPDAPLAPTIATLEQEASDYHAKLIMIEGLWRPTAAEETPTFVADSDLVFPPGVTSPAHSCRIRAEGIWIDQVRPGTLGILGPRYELIARRTDIMSGD